MPEEFESFERVAHTLHWSKTNDPAALLPIFRNPESGARVAVMVVEGMGNAKTQRKTSEYISKVQPDFAVLVGIAAGLHKATVGAVIIPTSIVKWDMGSSTDAYTPSSGADDSERELRQQLRATIDKLNAIVMPREFATEILALQIQRRPQTITVNDDATSVLSKIQRGAREGGTTLKKMLLAACPAPDDVPADLRVECFPAKPTDMVVTMDSVMACGDSVVKSAALQRFIGNATGGNVRGVAMEDFGFGQACAGASVPWAVLRGVSDLPVYKNDLNAMEKGMDTTFRDWAGENAAHVFFAASPFLFGGGGER